MFQSVNNCRLLLHSITLHEAPIHMYYKSVGCPCTLIPTMLPHYEFAFLFPWCFHTMNLKAAPAFLFPWCCHTMQIRRLSLHSNFHDAATQCKSVGCPCTLIPMILPHTVFAASANFFILWKQWYTRTLHQASQCSENFLKLWQIHNVHIWAKLCSYCAKLEPNNEELHCMLLVWQPSSHPWSFFAPTNFSLCVIYAHTLVETYCKSAPFTAHAQEGPWTLDPEIRSFWQEFKLLIR